MCLQPLAAAVRVPGAHCGYLAGPVTGAGCCGPARRRGLAELADDVVVVAVAEDACLVRLTIDDVIDLGGQVFIRLGGPAPVPLP